jgi:hypothetical protein
MDLRDASSLIGVITGPLGLMVALLVSFRDRAKVRVTLLFDMVPEGAPQASNRIGVIRIHNVGRRSVYLDLPHLIIPYWARKRFNTAFLLPCSGTGVTIAEGGAPHLISLPQADLTKYAEIWPYIRAAVVDAAGRTHYSAWPTEKPTWAGNHSHRFRVFTNKMRNRLRRLRP